MRVAAKLSPQRSEKLLGLIAEDVCRASGLLELDQATLVSYLGCSRRTAYNILRKLRLGEDIYLRRVYALKACRHLGIPLDEIFGDTRLIREKFYTKRSRSASVVMDNRLTVVTADVLSHELFTATNFPLSVEAHRGANGLIHAFRVRLDLDAEAPPVVIIVEPFIGKAKFWAGQVFKTGDLSPTLIDEFLKDVTNTIRIGS